MAVGENYDPSDVNSNLVEMWNGTTWSAPSTPGPAGTGELDSVSCSAANSCIAVGWYLDTMRRAYTTASVWNGATWALESPFNGSGQQNVLSGVSCLSTVCNAVGAYLSPSGIPVTLAEQRS